MYDWANSAFSTTVMAGFFPLFFKQYWSADTPATTSTFYLGIGNSFASLIIVLAAPVLGVIADSGGLKKRMLAAFAAAGILATAGFVLVGKGMWPAAILLYIIGIIGFSGANVFYDALLLAVSAKEQRHRVSALGYSLGYLGGGLLFLVNVIMTLKPHWFGLADAAEAVRWSFFSVAVWWALFAIPILLFVDESIDLDRPDAKLDRASTGKQSLRGMTRTAFKELRTTIKSISSHRNAALFLLAYWLYIDGVATIIRMAVDYGLSIGLPANSLIVALLMVQFIGFPATLIFGRIGEKYGPKFGLWIGLWAYVAATAYAYFMDTTWEFYGLAIALGLVQGGVQSLSRSMFSNLVPPGKSGEFFGFLNMMGKAAAVIGPVLVGFVAYMTKDPRLGLLSILILFFAGMLVLRLVEDETSLRNH